MYHGPFPGCEECGSRSGTAAFCQLRSNSPEPEITLGCGRRGWGLEQSCCPLGALTAPGKPGRGWGCGLHVERAVSFDSHLETGHWWSDQHHLGCLRYISFSAPGLVYFHFFETNSRNCGSLSCGYSLVIMALTFLPGVSGSVRKLIGYGSEYCL